MRDRSVVDGERHDSSLIELLEVVAAKRRTRAQEKGWGAPIHVAQEGIVAVARKQHGRWLLKATNWETLVSLAAVPMKVQVSRIAKIVPQGSDEWFWMLHESVACLGLSLGEAFISRVWDRIVNQENRSNPASQEIHKKSLAFLFECR